MSRVSRVLAHEINNSLSAILMYDGLLLERLGESDPGREAAEGMSEATRRAASLVRVPEGGVRLALDREGPPLAPRDLRSLRQRLEEMDGRLGAGPGFEVLLPPVACGVLPADPVTDE